MIEQFKVAKNVGTPLICVHTPDPAITLAKLLTTYQDVPVFGWDCINGITGCNTQGTDAVKRLFGDDDTTNAVTALEAAQKVPAGALFVVLNAHRGVEPTVNANWVQACWNLRSPYKRSGRTLVLLCPSVTWPPELAQDILTLDEPLPNTDELCQIITDTLRAAGEENPDAAMVEKAIDATCGLAAFPAEQVCAMSLKRDKETKKVDLKLDELWNRKAQMIESTPGLSVWRNGERFEDIGGYENVKTFLTRVVNGKRKPRGIVFMDEIEKLFAGATAGTGDTSGVSQGFLGTLLSYMQDSDSSGSIFIGPPGSGKSAVAKATGNTAGVPTICFDLSGMKASLVGESEMRLRSALKVVTAVTQGRAFFIATSNRIASLPPELRRRFRSGTYFFDLPTKSEREPIWNIYLQKYGIPASDQRPDDTDWTGAEIRQCCYLAAEELGCSLIDASQYIVPVAKSAEREIGELRAQAHGRFISASYPGFYRNGTVDAIQSASRAIESIPEE